MARGRPRFAVLARAAHASTLERCPALPSHAALPLAVLCGSSRSAGGLSNAPPNRHERAPAWNAPGCCPGPLRAATSAPDQRVGTQQLTGGDAARLNTRTISI